MGLGWLPVGDVGETTAGDSGLGVTMSIAELGSLPLRLLWALTVSFSLQSRPGEAQIRTSTRALAKTSPL